MTSTGADLDVELGRFAAELAWDDVPAATRERVTDIWLDAVANALAGRQAANTGAVERLAATLTGPGETTVVGGGSASMTGAAMINGFQVTAYTMCDVYRPALCHVTPEVVPAVLAVAEQAGASGRDTMAAFAVGLEVTTRLGLAVDYPRFRARGWHAPGVIGTIGAAAAAARLLGLNEDGIRRAMGLGASQAAGTFAALGTPAVKFHQARGAVSAVWAALFAADGLGGSDRALTHPDGGLLGTYADGGTPGLALEDLGERWELEQISLRRWPAASSLQAVVAATLSLAGDVDAADVDGVEVALPTTSFEMCAGMGWSDELSAMQSARFVPAVVLLDRECWVEQFGAERRSDPTVERLAASKIQVSCDPDLPPSGAVVRIGRGGRPDLVARCDVAPGDPRQPLAREELRAKLAAAHAVTPTAYRIDRLERELSDPAGIGDVADLCGGLRAPHGDRREVR